MERENMEYYSSTVLAWPNSYVNHSFTLFRIKQWENIRKRIWEHTSECQFRALFLIISEWLLFSILSMCVCVDDIDEAPEMRVRWWRHINFVKETCRTGERYIINVFIKYVCCNTRTTITSTTDNINNKTAEHNRQQSLSSASNTYCCLSSV